MNHEPKLVRSQSETVVLLLGGNREAGEAAGFVLGLDKDDSRFKLAMTSEAALGFWIGLSKAGEPNLLMHGEPFLQLIFCSNLTLQQSNEFHAYPSRQFFAMSHFISFEPLIVLVYARCFCLYAVLLSTTYILITTRF